MESPSSYARMLGQKEKSLRDYRRPPSPFHPPENDFAEPALDGGTVTETHDYLRLLGRGAATPHRPNCEKEIKQQTIDQIVDQVMALGEARAFSK